MTEGKIDQDKERKRSSKGHSLPEDDRRRDLSEHGNLKKITKYKALTSYRRQRDGPVRKRQENDRARGTDELKTAEGEICQEIERRRPSDEHLLPGDSRGGLVRIWKETDRARGTDSLRMAKRGTCQDTERNRLRERRSPTGDGRGRNLSGHGRNTSEHGHSLPEAEGGACQDK